MEGEYEIWGVTHNLPHVSKTNNVHFKYQKIDSSNFETLTEEMEEMFNKNSITVEERKTREKLIEWLNEQLKPVYPGGYLTCGGSTVSSCGTVLADIDLCYVIKTQESYDPSELPIERYKERRVNHFMLNRIAEVLNGIPGIYHLKLVAATVPIAKMVINLQEVGLTDQKKLMEVDINCNCVAGVYNSYLLGGLVNFDRRLAILSVVLKEWGKKVKIVDEKRFNSYALVLLIVHYLQCGVYPPVLPNLMKIFPSRFDGTLEPRDLSTSLEGLDPQYLKLERNHMNVGELLIGFLRYYSHFDMKGWGIRVKTGEAVDMNAYGDAYPKGATSSFFLEEPYDEITVPKNLRHQTDIAHIHEQFREMADLIYRSPSLATLYSVEKEYRSKRQRNREKFSSHAKGEWDETV
ncbi:unnamed protein product [Bursaphelenchus xylophilus]|uniref:(pine wood nematode) hypothetical protein n=1 Tax=Bursaphelenchus xylophilus TaxID=6326 RepID=A0A1I7SMG4_BURXY|nr:unnamed protein product [Bursaphelenchus xylophilus]CAG9130186.1 unnamed protein product [Bursaphelenchus xylophilus]